MATVNYRPNSGIAQSTDGRRIVHINAENSNHNGITGATGLSFDELPTCVNGRTNNESLHHCESTSVRMC